MKHPIVSLLACTLGLCCPACMSWKAVNGTVVPKDPQHGFTLPLNSPGAHLSGVYMNNENTALIFWGNGDCLFSYTLPYAPTKAALESTPGTAARYDLRGDSLLVEILSWDNEGRRFEVMEGRIKGETIDFFRIRWRDKLDWQPMDNETFWKCSVAPLSRKPFW